jgi:hypothetical protein
MPTQGNTALPRNLETTKKKLGKNLNKLVKPSNAPPIPKGDKGQSRNGLLLLSTKKSKGLLATSGNTGVKSANLYENSRASLYDPTVSSHTMLMNAVVGAAEASSATVPDAWGVAAAQQQLKMEQSMESMAKSMNGMSLDRPSMVEKSSSFGSSIQSQPSSKPTSPASPSRSITSVSTPAYESGISESQWDRRQPSGGVLWDPDSRHGRADEGRLDAVAVVADEHNPMIHLSSYLDPDRGERNSSAPRMLYDPKSGSLVEVKPKDDANNAKQRKERQVAKKAQRARDKVENGSSKAKEVAEKPVRKVLKKKEEEPATVEVSILAKPPEGKAATIDRKYPRTCGVLYARGPKGNFYCVDGCEADLGYGAHSVPGGRTKNAEAYAKFLKENQPHLADKSDADYYDYGVDKPRSSNSLGSDVVLQTGFQLVEKPVVMDWVKAGDKIELDIGEDDSPSLKPTAKEWAPSQAALAAAAAAATLSIKELFAGSDSYITASGNSKSSGNKDSVAVVTTTTSATAKTIVSSGGGGGAVHGGKISKIDSTGSADDVEIVHHEEDHDHLGLGFDPNMDMDFVMHSPPHSPKGPAGGIDIDIEPFDLGPRLYEKGASAVSGHKHLFAFSSGTWGGVNGNAAAASDDWGLTMNDPTKGIFGSEIFRADQSKDAVPYLSIATGHSWGASLVPGLGGGVAAMGGDGASSTVAD